VIVRIAGQGQYEVPAELVDRLNALDNEAVAAVEAGDEGKFHEIFGQMVSLVESDCTPVPDDDLAVSDVILPPPDLTFEEAQAEFTGEGLIPD